MRLTKNIPFIPLVLLSACSNEPVDIGDDPDPDPDGQYSLVLDLLPEEVVDVDLLFVMDNSGSMAEEQASIAAWAEESLFGVLELEPGTPLNLHIGIVSSDVGAGPYNISGCSGTGDDGGMQNAPRAAGCEPPTDAYIVDLDDGAGGRITNYAGTLDETFSCIAQLGIDGCGFEHPLESMRRAFDNPANAGFLRDDALLAVVIVSDEDDCSASDTSMFDTSETSIDDPLGPLSSFRCFEFGVVCDGDEPRAAGDKIKCAPRDASTYITEVSDYADYLKSLKDDPSMVVVAGIIGKPDRYRATVSTDVNGNPMLDPVCESAGGSAAPGIRLQAFFDSFPDRNRVASICSDDMSGPLEEAAMRIIDVARRAPCLRGDLVDKDLERIGLQPRCRTYEQTTLDGGMVQRTEIRPCSDGIAGPCFEVNEDLSACGHTQSALAVSISRSDAPPAGSHTVVECVTP